MKKMFPWWLKIIMKIVLSRIPFPYKTWEKLGLFRHGKMKDASYALNVFDKHFTQAGMVKGKEFVGLELGPGDSVVSVIIASAYGAKKTYLVDSGAYASTEVEGYKGIVQSLNKNGLVVTQHFKDNNFEGMLQDYKGEYLVQGLESVKKIADQSVDFIWSQAVFEHIRLHEFDDMMYELYRVLKEDGVCSHTIDLKDHLDYGLNNMRFTEKVWESKFMSQSGFYTNRIRFSDMVLRLKNIGFIVETINVKRWDKLPISKENISSDFPVFSEKELMISEFDVLLKK